MATLVNCKITSRILKVSGVGNPQPQRYLITWPKFYRINKLYSFLDENFLNSTFGSTFYEFGESHALV
jgi:hypothetical protein